MADTNITPNMGLANPVPSVAPGPQWAQDLYNAILGLDGHTHAPGSGIPVTPGGLNINADLPFNDNNATLIRSARFQTQGSPLGNAADLECVYVSGVDLYYNDGNGNQIQITSGGGVAGSPGSITGLVSPASATYIPGNETFVWQSDVNTPANMDMASATLRNLTANSHSYTLVPPAALATDYNLTLPAIGTAGLVAMNASGIQSVATPDNTTLQLSGSVLGVKNLGIGTAQLAAAAVTTAKIAANTIKQSNMAILAPNFGLVPPATVLVTTDTTMATVALTTAGGCVQIQFSNASIAADASIWTVKRNGTVISECQFNAGLIPIGAMSCVDNPSAGAHTYTLTCRVAGAGNTAQVLSITGNGFMWVYEL